MLKKAKKDIEKKTEVEEEGDEKVERRKGWRGDSRGEKKEEEVKDMRIKAVGERRGVGDTSPVHPPITSCHILHLHFLFPLQFLPNPPKHRNLKAKPAQTVTNILS